MATEYSSIDHLLTGNKTEVQPQTPEDMRQEESVYTETEPEIQEKEEVEPEQEETSDSEEEETREQSSEDEYGNKKAIDNEVIRERLARQAESLNRKHQQAMEELKRQLTPQQQHAADNFEYNPNAEGDWQQQLAAFVKHTVNNMTQEQKKVQQEQIERQAQAEFEAKFYGGMSKFGDFVEVVGAQPITDAMTIATRSMKDPAAFLYAASKRAPQELQRISSLRDPYAQIAAMGALETSLKRKPEPSKAPKPLSRTPEDGIIEHKKKKTETIEDLIAQADKRKMANLDRRRAVIGGRR